MEIIHLYISPDHNYFGHHGKPPDAYPILEVSSITCIAGHGIRGDRFFDYKVNYKGQVTFFAGEVFDALCTACGVYDKPVSVLRRNIVTRSQDLCQLIGREFEVDDVRFVGVEECHPCYWMNQAFSPGAENFLRGNGGLRARILTSGEIRVPQRAMLYP